MKKLCLVVLFLVGLVHAAEDRISLVFDEVSLVDLARLGYGEIAKDQVVFTHQALQAHDTVSVTLRNVERTKAVGQIRDLLKAAGYQVENRNGITWIDKAGPEVLGEFFYRPKYRPVSYLVDMLSPVFKQGAFTLQRGVSMPQTFMQQQPSASPMQQTAVVQQPQIVDSGTSAYSLQDKNPDAFIFRGSKPDIEHLQGLLAQVDTAIPEILVKAVVYEVTTSSQDGSALSLAAQLVGGKLGIKLGSATPGDYSAVFKGSSLQVIFDVLSTDSRFKQVSSPTLRVKSGSSARLTVGADTPVLGSVQLDKNGNPIQSVDYKPSGVILSLTPQIRAESADLQIDQQISSFIPTTNGVNNSPTLIKRQLSTSVGVRNDEVLVLGGLDDDKSVQGTSGPSFLPTWLHSDSSQKARSEILLILQAQRI